MPILTADRIDVTLGGRRIFQGDTLALEPRERLGVVGPNGAGKSTLLRILAGLSVPDGGYVARAEGCRVGYLPQEHGQSGEGTLLQTVLATAPGREALTHRIHAIEADLGRAMDQPTQLSLAGQLSEALEELNHLEQDYGAHQAEKILSGLGFQAAEFGRPLKTFSGGWRMRGALAALLYARPDVLLLDEPTNHLDLPSVRWLDGFLRSFPRAIVLTCHDRAFLNRQITRVASLEPEGLRHYPGNYDHYVEQRALEVEYLEARTRKDEQRKKELEAFVTRFRAKASKARQAQSKSKMIEKMQAEMIVVPKLRRTMAIQFPPCERAGDPAIRVEGLGFGYGERRLFDRVDLTVRRGERIAIVGLNGAGKSTLLGLLAGALAPLEGRIVYGRNVALSYFAQHHTEALSLDRSVLDEVWRANETLPVTAVRTLCGAFLFSGDDVEKPIRVLSGGEKARVALARMLAAPGNLLLLDEPTNHLDTEAADRLTESLRSHEGTLVFVSHSVYFARSLATTVWDVGHGSVTVHLGGLDDFEATQASSEERVPPGDTSAGDPRKAARMEARDAAKQRSSQERRARAALEKTISTLEREIASTEAEQARIEAALAEPEAHTRPNELRTLSEGHRDLAQRLEQLMARWEEAQTQLLGEA